MWLAKFLAACGFGSRRKCIDLIKSGQVKVNNTIIVDPVLQVTNEEIYVNNQKATLLSPKLFLYYKKPGYIVSHSDDYRKTIFDDTSYDLISVGRLDYYTEGLMLLTNSANIAHFWETSKCVREYCIICIGKIPNPWQEYYVIDGARYGPVKLLSIVRLNHIYLEVRISICEGKNREIRNICKYYDWKINRLIRTKFGPFSLDQITEKLTAVKGEHDIIKHV